MVRDGTRIPPTIPRERKPVWLSVAEAELGVRELPGGESSPRILEYYKATNLGGSPEDSSTPWCSAFVNWVMEHAGYRGTRRANARSWLNWGEQEPSDNPRPGSIAVLWRGTPQGSTGHVGFYVGRLDRNQVWLLGGNQGNEVGLSLYGEGRILAYRWPMDRDRK